MKFIEKAMLLLIVATLLAALISMILIIKHSLVLPFDFSSSGFEYFMCLFSFPIKMASASLALFSVYGVIHTIMRARLSFQINQLYSEIHRCEDEIKLILSSRIPRESILMVINSKLVAQKQTATENYFSRMTNADLSIDEIIPHLTKCDIKESDGIYRITTQNLTLNLQRYVIALWELYQINDEKYLIRYYATKYISLMKDLYHYGAEIDLELIHLSYQLASTEFTFKFDVKSINGSKAENNKNMFYSSIGNPAT